MVNQSAKCSSKVKLSIPWAWEILDIAFLCSTLFSFACFSFFFCLSFLLFNMILKAAWSLDQRSKCTSALKTLQYRWRIKFQHWLQMSSLIYDPAAAWTRALHHTCQLVFCFKFNRIWLSELCTILLLYYYFFEKFFWLEGGVTGKGRGGGEIRSQKSKFSSG